MAKKPEPAGTSPPPEVFKARAIVRGDIDMGKKIRLRRVEIGMSQSDLAGKLGVTFQQVQKYEKGVNRVSANRLEQIADALGVPVTFFYRGPGTGKGQSEVESLLFLDSNFSLRLLRSYAAIKNLRIQRQIVSLMEELAAAPSNAK